MMFHIKLYYVHQTHIYIYGNRILQYVHVYMTWHGDDTSSLGFYFILFFLLIKCEKKKSVQRKPSYVTKSSCFRIYTHSRHPLLSLYLSLYLYTLYFLISSTRYDSPSTPRMREYVYTYTYTEKLS